MFGLHCFQPTHQRWAVVPTRVARTLDDIVALERRHWNSGNASQSKRLGESFKVAHNFFKRRSVKCNRVHFIHSQRNIANSHQRN